MATIFNILFLAAMAEVFLSVNAVDYCSISCKGSIHTMCKYKSSVPGPACNQIYQKGLTDAEKNAIVRKHNELRQRVASGNENRGRPGPQPPAVSMPYLTWDNELATVAQRWANQCTYHHDKCRNVERFAVGQNIAISRARGTKPRSIEYLIEKWYNEVARFNNHYVSAYRHSNAHTGHYTQMLWAKTLKIGCGRVQYKDARGKDTNYLVCNYGPAGNYLGRIIYKIRK